MVGVEEGREFRFRGDLYSQESTFPLVSVADIPVSIVQLDEDKISTLLTQTMAYADSKWNEVS